jgi:lipopolysaccharide transport system ATP-binding protein
MKEPAVVFDNVSKNFPLYHHLTGGIKNFLFNLPEALNSMRNNKFEALKNICFKVHRGETLGIIGRNGAGKSTILGLMAGVLKPSAGKIVVKGQVAPLLELGSGFHPELTGRENIMLNGVLLGLTRAEVVRKMAEIMEFSELGEFIDQPIRVYSSGMLARLGFSVVAHLDPDISLIDEILAVGDLNFQKKCLDKMISFKKSGVTIIFVSHSMPDIIKICDRVVWIDDHTVRSVGEPKEVAERYVKAIE